jgi:pepF/M3 family oligoendopeptidase
MNESTASLPRWDLSVYFPSVTSPEFDAAFAAVVARIVAFGELCDRHGIAERPTAPLTESDVVAFEAVATEFNGLLDDLRVIRAYVHGFVATDSRDADAQARASDLRRESIPLSLLSVRFTAWLGALDTEALIARSPLAAAHAYYVREAKVAATHLMPAPEEALAAQLNLSGSSAWGRLHGDITSQLLVDSDGEKQPMSVVRARATDPDPGVRSRAYAAELATWQTVAVPLAAALNSIKHETNVLTAKRGWADPLDAACFANHIDRPTLDAMLSAATASFPAFRRYLRAKARLVSGASQLAWHDLFAPVGKESQPWSWADAETFIEGNFRAYSPKMGDFARRTFAERWIDAEPRPGKRDGAFCMGTRPGESRILQNYRPSFDGVSTLAHELGHAYHNRCLAERTPMQGGTPMTLAETASIFCETIVTNAALGALTDPQEQLAILEGSLQNSTQVVVDISSRFLFERAVLEKRRERDLSPEELCTLMVQSQKDTYGDGLDPGALHPYMWAVKGHYYGATYYNFPYMFGLLFGLGLYARYQADPDGFRAGYDELLSATGLDDAATLAARFGIDIRQEAFWKSSLDVIGAQIERFERLATAA